VRDSIVPYTTARKAGWNDVIFLGPPRPTTRSSARRRAWTASTPWASPRCPTSIRRCPTVKKFVEDYKKRFNVDPNIGAVYGYVAADLTVQGLKNAGKDLTTRQLHQGLEAIKTTRTSSTARQVSFGPNIRQGANSSFLAEVKGGRLDRVTEPLGF
jgi:branched-chain amino acid transport system substrate-binding protein